MLVMGTSWASPERVLSYACRIVWMKWVQMERGYCTYPMPPAPFWMQAQSWV